MTFLQAPRLHNRTFINIFKVLKYVDQWNSHSAALLIWNDKFLGLLAYVQYNMVAHLCLQDILVDNSNKRKKRWARKLGLGSTHTWCGEQKVLGRYENKDEKRKGNCNKSGGV